MEQPGWSCRQILTAENRHLLQLRNKLLWRVFIRRRREGFRSAEWKTWKWTSSPKSWRKAATTLEFGQRSQNHYSSLKRTTENEGGVIFYCLANEPRYASMPRVDRLNWYARGGRAWELEDDHRSRYEWLLLVVSKVRTLKEETLVHWHPFASCSLSAQFSDTSKARINLKNLLRLRLTKGWHSDLSLASASWFQQIISNVTFGNLGAAQLAKWGTHSFAQI